jgi:predicted nucleic acid-binding protein
LFLGERPWWKLDVVAGDRRPASPSPVGSRDPDDDYVLALAIDRRAYLVTGDQDLLGLSNDLPILTPAQFAVKPREAH